MNIQSQLSFNRNRVGCFFVKCRRRSLLLLVNVFAFGLTGCAGGYYAEADNLPPDSPYEKAWLDEHSGNDENLGPNSPGYIGPDGEYSMYPDDDPH